MHSSFDLHNGDCLEVLRTMADNSVDAVVTDPPYGLAFMGKRWDYDVPSVEIWAECLRVLKPGGHLLAFAGTRTQHRMAVRIEDAGFEIRDMIAWVYGSGFPKSLDVSKAIDKAAGAEREVIGKRTMTQGGGSSLQIRMGERREVEANITAPATDAAKQWHGWGTALKPALEPITVARKPLIGTVAANVLTWGTGGVNVDGCRVEGADAQEGRTRHGGGVVGNASSYELPDYKAPMPAGRWPANLIHDGSDEVVGLFPEGSFNKPTVWKREQGKHEATSYGLPTKPGGSIRTAFGDTGSAARFFYCAKASKRDRDEGCEGLEAKARPTMGSGIGGQPNQQIANNKNAHPTVKPTDLMRYLCRLVTPPGGVVLDPFMGSGSTGKGAILEGFRFIGIEREAEYIDIARARIQHAVEKISTQPALDL